MTLAQPNRVRLGTIAQLSSSPGGMPKLPIERANITVDGIPGDWQKNRKYHGGADRALCLFSVELYDWLRDEHGIDLKFGSVGENITTRGFDLMSLEPGDQLSIGGAIAQITDIRVPCASLKKWHKDLAKIIKGRSGWVARVGEAGAVTVGDAIDQVVNR